MLYNNEFLLKGHLKIQPGENYFFNYQSEIGKIVQTRFKWVHFGANWDL